MFTLAAASAYSGNSLVSDFNLWKSTHNKKYDTSAAEASALAAFASNDAIIKEHNAQKLSYELGHNQFSDMTWDEFHETIMHGGLHRNYSPKNSQRVFIKTGAPMADSVDWVAKGAVTPVKDQARCGSCWAFSTTGSVEGGLFVNEGKLVSLSEQDLVSCDHGGDQGCQGGLMDNAFKWIETNGICSEADYPYTSGTGSSGTCKTPKCSPVATLTGFKDVPSKDEDALKSAISGQPVSVAIEADKSAFQLYKSGILDSATCGTKLDHGVLAVGYGTDSGTDYYKVKNSWGATWGENGYVRMVQGKNMCGIAMQASYPTGVKSEAPGPGPAPGPSPPSPTPPSPPAGSSHYGDPKDGCMSDEQSITIQGVTGDFCSPACTGILKTKCPSDVPAGVTAAPQCALQDSGSGDKYCALLCSPSNIIKDQKAADAQCGTNASCKPIQTVGLCTYDD